MKGVGALAVTVLSSLSQPVHAEAGDAVERSEALGARVGASLIAQGGLALIADDLVSP